MKIVQVELKRTSSPILIGYGLLKKLPRLMAKQGLDGEVVVISDQRVASLYGEQLREQFALAGRAAQLLQVPEGEESKSLEQCERLYRELISRRCSRSVIILALGGGMVGDLAGFVAATFLRGVRLVQIPTTLLAQVDSSIGGKTGVNHPLGKNLIGAFHQPEMVCIDPAVLATLDRRDRLAGMAEVAKYALIQDRGLMASLSLNLDALVDLRYPELTEKIIETCCSIKAGIVSADERERGRRALLNFGHTIGHALEAASGFGHFRHGEAVTRGMAGAIWLSRQIAHLSKQDAKAGLQLLSRLEPPSPPSSVQVKQILYHMRHDKKWSGEKQSWILIDSIGSASIVHDLPGELIVNAVRFACSSDW